MERLEYEHNDDSRLRRHHRRSIEEEPVDKYRNLRQWLNILFMLGAVAGVFLYIRYGGTVSTVVILVSMVLKMIECVLRLLK